MDSRLDLFGALGLEIGDAHLIRNAGGLPTDDVLRSLALSQHSLGTREVVLIHHTDCGMQGLDDAAFRDALAADAEATTSRRGTSPDSTTSTRRPAGRCRRCATAAGFRIATTSADSCSTSRRPGSRRSTDSDRFLFIPRGLQARRR